MRYAYGGPVREDWLHEVKRQGLVYVKTTDPVTGEEYSYWMEDKYFVFKESETEIIGQANRALWDAYLEAGEEILAFERACHWDPANPNQRDPYHRDRDCYFHKLGIPEWLAPAIIRTWQLDEPDRSACRTLETEYWPCLYGRYDFSVERDVFGNIIGVKLMEFNADTPTCLVESVIQRDWFEALHMHPGRDQWNTLRKDPVRGNLPSTRTDTVPEDLLATDNLVDRWIHELSLYRQKWGHLPEVIHVAYDATDESHEDKYTCIMIYEALLKAAQLMGTHETSAFAGKLIRLQDIELVQAEGNPTVPDGPLAGAPIGKFYDADGLRVKLIFKLNPWEAMMNQEFGKAAAYDLLTDDPTVWIEPPYKLLWSNKGFLAVLWELFKNDERYSKYLLPTFFKGDPNIPAGFMDNCVDKPIFGREGANTIVIQNGVIVEQGPNGGYGAEGRVVQQLAPLPTFHDPDLGEVHAVIGSWMLGDTGAGLCTRVSQGRITNNLSRFAPHYFKTGV